MILSPKTYILQSNQIQVKSTECLWVTKCLFPKIIFKLKVYSPRTTVDRAHFYPINHSSISCHHPFIFSTEGGQTYALDSVTGEEIWSVKTGEEVAYGLAIPEDYQDLRCGAATIHFMDDMVMLDKMFDDMFDGEDGLEKMDENDEVRMEEDEEGTVENTEEQETESEESTEPAGRV